MNRMTQRNLEHIKERFTCQTGVELNRRKSFPGKKMVLLTAVVIASLLLAAFGYPCFTPLDGDALVLQGRYQGNGVVAVYVENGSDKNLEFQEQVRLMCWQTGREVPRMTGVPRFDNCYFAGDSSGIMTIDLSEIYDLSELEQEDNNFSYYLLLTNNSFLFGHDWMCSVSFREDNTSLPEKQVQYNGIQNVELLDAVEPGLRFYFEESYNDQVFAWEEAHGNYLQKVDELLEHADGTAVSPVSPTILVSGPSTLLEPQPWIDTKAMAGSDTEWTALDGYARLIGAGILEKALAVTVEIPYVRNPESFDRIPVRYYFVYDADSVSRGNSAFVYGQLVSLEKLEEYRVFSDEHYCIYDITDYLYSDLEAYLDFLRNTRQDLTTDEKTLQKVRDISDYYRENISGLINYMDTEKTE